MMLTIRLRGSARDIRVEAGRVFLDGFGERAFCVHNAIDHNNRIIDHAFTVTDYKTGVSLAVETYGPADAAVRAANLKVASNKERVARALAGLPIINTEVL